MRAATVLSGLALLLGQHAMAAAALVVKAPPLIVGRKTPATIVVTNLPGQGPVRARANVGQVHVTAVSGTRVELTYRCPRRGSPQRLLMLLWRPTGPAHRVRLPLSAWAEVEVKTERGEQAKVTIKVGDRTFGPVVSGRRGKVKIKVLVPPTISTVEAIARSGVNLVTQRTVELPAFNEKLLVVGMRQVGSRKQRDLRYDIFVATADDTGTPKIVLVGPHGKRRSLPQIKAGGAVTTAWAPGDHDPAGSWSLELVSGDGTAAARERKTIDLAPAPTRVVRSRQSPPASPRRWRVGMAALVGLQHNLGAFFSPTFDAEVSIDFASPWGFWGVQLSAGVAFDGQTIGDAGFLAENRLWLIPVELALTFTTATYFGISGQVQAGGVAQLVHSTSSGTPIGAISQTTIGFGFFGAIGAGYRLGPGDVVLRVGYRHVQVQNADLDLRGGGLLLSTGYRLLF